MSHGAPKRIDVIPMAMVVQIFAWEGLLYTTQRQLADTLKAILDGDDSKEKWDDLNRFRIQTVQYSQEYTKAIMRLQFSQNR